MISVSDNVVPVEDILGINSVGNTLIEAARNNESIICHYIAQDLRICLDNLNEVNNGFTWMKGFTQGLHKMAKPGIFKTSNGKTVRKWNALFRVEEHFTLLRK